MAVLNEHELGVAGTELCRRVGISENTFYRWKRVYGGLRIPASQPKSKRALVSPTGFSFTRLLQSWSTNGSWGGKSSTKILLRNCGGYLREWGGGKRHH